MKEEEKKKAAPCEIVDPKPPVIHSDGAGASSPPAQPGTL